MAGDFGIDPSSLSWSPRWGGLAPPRPAAAGVTDWSAPRPGRSGRSRRRQRAWRRSISWDVALDLLNAPMRNPRSTIGPPPTPSRPQRRRCCGPEASVHRPGGCRDLEVPQRLEEERRTEYPTSMWLPWSAMVNQLPDRPMVRPTGKAGVGEDRQRCHCATAAIPGRTVLPATGAWMPRMAPVRRGWRPGRPAREVLAREVSTWQARESTIPGRCGPQRHTRDGADRLLDGAAPWAGRPRGTTSSFRSRCRLTPAARPIIAHFRSTARPGHA